VSSAWAERLGIPADSFVPVHNPVQADVDRLRRDPIPTLLAQVSGNLQEREQGALFEIAKGYEPREGDLPHERKWVGAVLWAPEDQGNDGPDGLFGSSRSMVEEILRTSGVEAKSEPGIEHAAAPWCHPARSLTWKVGDRILGYSGLVDPRLLRTLEFKRCACAGVLIDLAVLTELFQVEGAPFRQPGRFPAVKVDVAIALPESVPYADVETALRKAGGKTLESLELFDVFRGGSLGGDERSLAFHALLRAADRTLTEKDERKFLDKVERAATELGGKLRS
jgi:phenylalanyl-tRNA synthetase beta chain